MEFEFFLESIFALLILLLPFALMLAGARDRAGSKPVGVVTTDSPCLSITKRSK